MKVSYTDLISQIEDGDQTYQIAGIIYSRLKHNSAGVRYCALEKKNEKKWYSMTHFNYPSSKGSIFRQYTLSKPCSVIFHAKADSRPRSNKNDRDASAHKTSSNKEYTLYLNKVWVFNR